MTRFIVLGKEPVIVERNVSKRQATRKQKNRLATLTLAREDDLGVNDRQFEERSTTGYLLKAGDVCMGYDLTETQFVDDEAEEDRSMGKLPDLIILRKLYGGVATGEADASKKRIWRLQRLDVEVADNAKSARGSRNDVEAEDMDEEDFMQEVEADKEMRSQMNLYKSEYVKKKPIEPTSEMENGEEDEDDQQIKLDELLDGLVLDAPPDGEDFVEGTFDEYLEQGEKAAKDGIAYVGREDARNVRDKEAAIPASSFGKEFGTSCLG